MNAEFKIQTAFIYWLSELHFKPMNFYSKMVKYYVVKYYTKNLTKN